MRVLCAILLLSVVMSKCTSLQGECTRGMYKDTVQFNVNWKGAPTYVDRLNNVYDLGVNCGVRTYTMLFHQRLSCDTADKKTYQCNSTVESVWVRIWDTTFYQNIIDNCGKKWMEEYQDVMKTPCYLGTIDLMYYAKQNVGKQSNLTVAIENRKPVEYGGMHYGGECIWEYEIEGFWSTLVITIFSIAIGVVLILVIALYIYANKHRAEKRANLLNRSLVEGDEKTPAV